MWTITDATPVLETERTSDWVWKKYHILCQTVDVTVNCVLQNESNKENNLWIYIFINDFITLIYNNHTTTFHLSHKNSPWKNPTYAAASFPIKYCWREENLLTMFRLLLARNVLLFEECKSFRVQMLENKMKIG
jgi:hypothetical protein